MNKLEKIMTNRLKDKPNLIIPFYLMMSYAYYEDSNPIASDQFFDLICKKILREWDSLEHPHKYLINKDMLKAGTYIGKYPTVVKFALADFRNS